MGKNGFAKVAIAVAVGMLVAVGFAESAEAQRRYSPPKSLRYVRNANSLPEFQQNYASRVFMETRAAVDRYELALEVARCVVLADPASGRIVGGQMSADPDFRQLAATIEKRHGHCVNKWHDGLPLLYVNGALAETLVERERTAFADKVMPADIPAAQAFYLTERGFTLETLGRCMAVFSPGLIRKLMVERPGTRSESEAIKAVMRSTPECRPVELADDIPDAAIRSALAAGLFHWSRPGEERATAGEEYRIEGQLTP